jgi:hypothetical protein
MDFYNRLLDTAYKLLSKRGRTVVLRIVTVGAYNPATGKSTESGSVDSNRKGLIVDAPANRVGVQYGENIQPGTTVKTNTKWVYLDAKGTAPTMQDRIVIDNIEFSIIDVQTYKPATVALMYLVVLKA